MQSSHGLLQRLRGDSGQTTVELALVVPLLCFLLVLSVDFGRAVLYWLDATHLANLGAREAAVNYVPSDNLTLQQWIQSQALSKDVRDSSDSRVSICIPEGDGMKGDPVRVTVSFPYKLVSFPFIHYSGPTLTLTGKSTMRLEQDSGGQYLACPS